MNKKQRTIFFFAMVIIFSIIGPAIIMYSQGYRFDVKKFQFVETGGIYIKARPEEVDLYVNDKYIQKSSLFTRDILVQNLLPGNYNIKVEKDGYHSWEKNLDIKTKNVTEAKDIFLFRKNIEFEEIKDNVVDFYLNNNQVIILTKLNELFLYTSNKLDKILNASQTPNNIEKIYFLSNDNVIIKTTTGLHYLLENKNIKLIKSFNIDTKNITNRDNKIVYQFKNSIYEIDPREDIPELLSRDHVDAFTVDGNSIIALRKNKVVRLYDLKREEEELYNFNYYKEGSNYQLFLIGNQLFILEDEKNLYFLDKENRTFEEKIKATSDLKYTSFFNKIIFYDENNIWLMLLKRIESPFFKDAYSVIKIGDFNKKIENIKWLNGSYFVFTLDKEIFISEIDNRDKLNMFSLNEFDVSNIFFNGNRNELFILNDDQFLKAEKIIPSSFISCSIVELSLLFSIQTSSSLSFLNLWLKS